MSKSIKFVVIAVVIIVALIAGIAYYAQKTAIPRSVVYNNYQFNYSADKKWHTQQYIKGKLYDIPFYYTPQETLDIPLDDLKTIMKVYAMAGKPNSTVYVTMLPNESSKLVVAGVEYVRLLGKGYDILNLNVKSAITDNEGKQVEQQVMTCANSSNNILVIHPYTGNQNRIYSEKNCILLESINATESIRVADAFAYRILTIIR